MLIKFFLKKTKILKLGSILDIYGKVGKSHTNAKGCHVVLDLSFAAHEEFVLED